MTRVGESVAGESVQHEVSCPHCRRTFTGELIQGSAARYSGFKCPHCRLFVPYERADEPETPDDAT